MGLKPGTAQGDTLLVMWRMMGMLALWAVATITFVCFTAEPIIQKRMFMAVCAPFEIISTIFMFLVMYPVCQEYEIATTAVWFNAVTAVLNVVWISFVFLNKSGGGAGYERIP